jgi:hypothetical protein
MSHAAAWRNDIVRNNTRKRGAKPARGFDIIKTTLQNRRLLCRIAREDFAIRPVRAAALLCSPAVFRPS